MTIPELFERVAAKVPEVRPVGLKHNGQHWWLDYYVVMDNDAHMLIEAACWRLLPGYWWEDQKLNSPGNRYVVHNSENAVASRGASITEALLLAVERVHGDKR